MITDSMIDRIREDPNLAAKLNTLEEMRTLAWLEQALAIASHKLLTVQGPWNLHVVAKWVPVKSRADGRYVNEVLYVSKSIRLVVVELP
jgi:hypothetical protein